MAPIIRTRAEISFIRLLARCEELASSNATENWKLVNFVAALEDKLSDIKKLNSADKPPADTMKEYAAKVAFLKNFIDTQNTQATSEVNAKIHLPSPSIVKSIPSDIEYPVGQQIQIQASARVDMSMRDQLMLTGKEKASGLRQRSNPSHDEGLKDAGEVIKHHQKIHEQIAGEMLNLTRSLKHNIVTSRKVIQDDLEVLSKSDQQTDSNLGNLKKASSRLDGHLKKGTNWWLWICLALVCAVFLFMIFFIRFFPKR